MNSNPLNIDVNFFPYANALKGTKEYYGEKINLMDILIKQHDVYYDQINHLRHTKDENLKRNYKAKMLPCYFVSCLLENNNKGSRYLNDLVYHTNLVVLDLDNCKKDADLIKKELSKLPQVAYCAKSCSGNGLFAIFKINEPVFHHECYTNIFPKLCSEMGIENYYDHSGSNINRLRFITYDKNYYLNSSPKSIEIKNRKIYSIPKHKINHKSKFKSSDNIKIQQLINQISLKKIDLVNNYNDWIKIGLALTQLGEEGRKYFHDISRQNHKYDEYSCERKYDLLMKESKNKISIGTIFWEYYKKDKI
jgi:hypothetical protein